MHIMPFLVWTFILVAGCSTSPLAETCDELKSRCYGLSLQQDEYRYELMREQWPVTDDKVNQTAQTGKLFCRLSQEYGQCLLTMNQRCPGYTTPENGNGWFGATWEKFMGKLCDTPFPPQRYIPVVYGQCYAQNADIVPSLVLSPTSPYVLQSISASSAQENACSAMSDMQAHMNGTAAAIARKCDQEAARVLVEGTRYLHQINCPG